MSLPVLSKSVFSTKIGNGPYITKAAHISHWHICYTTCFQLFSVVWLFIKNTPISIQQWYMKWDNFSKKSIYMRNKWALRPVMQNYKQCDNKTCTPVFPFCYMTMTAFRDIALCSQQAPLKRRSSSTRLNGALSHNVVVILAVLRTWNIASYMTFQLDYPGGKSDFAAHLSRASVHTAVGNRMR
jgi:hypothetical protein